MFADSDKCVSIYRTDSDECVSICRTDSDNWKDFLSKPSINYVLRFLTGVCDGHEKTQV